MKQLSLFIVVFFVTLECISQSISGTVLDGHDKKALQGAKIMIGGSTQSTTTDENGHFAVRSKRGEQRIVVSLEGYETYDEKHIIDSSVCLEIAMQAETNETNNLHLLETVSDKRTPATYENYEHAYMEIRNIMRDIPYRFEYTPSLVALSEGGYGLGNTSCRIRGMGMEAIGMSINGIPINDPESRITMWNHLPDFASMARNIRITRGTGSSTRGAYAHGASIDICTKQPSSKPYGDITIIGGSYNTIKASLSAGTGLMKNGFSIDLNMAKVMSEGYIRGSDLNQNVIMLSAVWKGKVNSLNANIIHSRQKTGITMWGCPSTYLETDRRYNSAGEYFDSYGRKQYYDNEIENYNQTHVQLLYSQKIWNNVELNVKLHYNRSDGYFEEYLNRQNFTSYGLQNISIPTVMTIGETTYTSFTTITYTDLIRRRSLANNLYFGQISATHKIGRFINTFSGAVNIYKGHYFGNIVWMRYAGNTEKDHNWYNNTSLKTDYNAFYKAEYTIFDKLTIYADLQYRIVNYEIDGNDCDLLSDGKMKNLDDDIDYNFFNPKGGINYEITKNMRLYASVARSNREPSRNDIKDLIGTGKNIEPESLIDYELGYSFQSKVFSGSLTLYHMDFNNQIVPTGEFSKHGYYIMTNVDRSYRSGIEFSTSIRPHKRINIEANATYSRNRIKDYIYTVQTFDENDNESYEEKHISNTKIAYSPEIVAAGSICYNIFGNFSIYYNIKYVGKQHFDNTSSNNRYIKAYCISSAGFDYAIVTKYVKGMRFKFEVNNLFNAVYYDNAYGGHWYEQGAEHSWANYFPQAGISFMGGISISF